MDAAVRHALSDDEGLVQLSASSTPQSFDELTTFNDAIRRDNDWVDVDLDAALTPEQAQALAEWRDRQRVQWTTGDVSIVGLAGLLGSLCVWFDAAIDRSVRDRLGKIAQTSTVRGWEKLGKRLPIDYMGERFGGRAHRVKSAGHDIARPFEALRQIMDGEFRGIRWSFGSQSSVSVSGRFLEVNTLEEALLRWILHLSADVLTSMSLPIPGMSLLYEMDNKSISNFALHAYSGLRAGEGLNMRSATVAPTMTVLTVEVVVRTHAHLAAYRENGTAELSPQQKRKRTELLLASHAVVSAASLGKATAMGMLTKHPSAVRHIHVPTLIRAGTTALQVVADERAARQASAATWDALLLDTAHVWQLDLAQEVERAWSSQL